MDNFEKLLEQTVEEWRNNRCIGTFIIPNPVDTRPLLLSILQKRYTRYPSAKTLLVVDSWDTRCKLIEYITTQDCEENNEEFKTLIKNKNLLILTRNGVCSDKFNGVKGCDLIVVWNLSYFPHKLAWYYAKVKYKLTVLNKILEVSTERNALYKLSPVIGNFSQANFDKLRTSTPVEEELIDVNIPDDTEEYRLLQYYNEYISTSLNIFGSFEIMQQARIGNDKFNISANQVCYQIADENGWKPNLDMNIDINVQVDAMFNPTNIKERAVRTYEIIRSRGELLSNYEGKLKVINDLINKHSNEKILIINKRGAFAHKITEYLNMMSGQIICGDYHDHVDPIPELDDDGKPVRYKSGAKKGKQKFLGSTAQKHRNEQLFAANKLSVLSTNNAPDKGLNADISVVIITSPQCETIESYMYRLANVCYPKNKIKLYTIYVKNSLEEKKLQSRTIADTHTIVNKCENVVVSENNFDFVVVD